MGYEYRVCQVIKSYKAKEEKLLTTCICFPLNLISLKKHDKFNFLYCKLQNVVQLYSPLCACSTDVIKILLYKTLQNTKF